MSERKNPESDARFPVTLEKFMKYTYHEEMVHKILSAKANGDAQKLQEYLKSESLKRKALTNYYKKFYLDPSIRQKHPIRFKPMPSKEKAKLMQMAVLQENKDSQSKECFAGDRATDTGIKETLQKGERSRKASSACDKAIHGNVKKVKATDIQIRLAEPEETMANDDAEPIEENEPLTVDSEKQQECFLTSTTSGRSASNSPHAKKKSKDSAGERRKSLSPHGKKRAASVSPKTKEKSLYPKDNNNESVTPVTSKRRKMVNKVDANDEMKRKEEEATTPSVSAEVEVNTSEQKTSSYPAQQQPSPSKDNKAALSLHYTDLKKHAHLCPVTYNQFLEYTNLAAVVTHAYAKQNGQDSNQFLQYWLKKSYLLYYLHPELRSKHQILRKIQVLPNCPDPLKEQMCAAAKLNTTTKEESSNVVVQEEIAKGAVEAFSDKEHTIINPVALNAPEILDTAENAMNNRSQLVETMVKDCEIQSSVRETLPNQLKNVACNKKDTQTPRRKTSATEIHILEDIVLPPLAIEEQTPPLKLNPACRGCNISLQQFMEQTNVLSVLRKYNQTTDSSTVQALYIRFMKLDNKIAEKLMVSGSLVTMIWKYPLICTTCEKSWQLSVQQWEVISNISAEKPTSSQTENLSFGRHHEENGKVDIPLETITNPQGLQTNLTLPNLQQSDEHEITSSEDLPPNVDKIEQALAKMCNSKRWLSIIRDRLLKALKQPFDDRQLPVTFNDFKRCSRYEEPIDQILREYCAPHQELFTILRNDRDLFDSLAFYYYNYYFRNPNLRKVYPLRLKLCPAKLRASMQSVLSVEEENDSDRERVEMQLAAKENKQNKDNQQSLSGRAALKVSDNKEAEETFLEGTINDARQIIGGNENQKDAQRSSVEETVNNGSQIKQADVNQGRNNGLSTLTLQKQSLEVDSNQAINVAQRRNSLHSLEQTGKSDGKVVPLTAVLEDNSMENNLHTKECETPKVAAVVTDAANAGSGSTLMQNESHDNAKTPERLRILSLPKDVFQKPMSFDVNSKKLEAEKTITSNPSVKDNAVRTKPPIPRKPKHISVPKANEWRIVNRETSPNFGLREPVDKSLTLAYVLRTSFGLKQSIIKNILALSLEEFTKLTHIYKSQALSKKHIPQWYELACKRSIWPKDLYIRLEDLCQWLNTKCIEIPEPKELLKYISPKFLHWSNLLDTTTFLNCVLDDYNQRAGEMLDDKNTQAIQEICEHYYHRCWYEEQWIGGIIPKLNANLCATLTYKNPASSDVHKELHTICMEPLICESEPEAVEPMEIVQAGELLKTTEKNNEKQDQPNRQNKGQQSGRPILLSQPMRAVRAASPMEHRSNEEVNTASKAYSFVPNNPCATNKTFIVQRAAMENQLSNTSQAAIGDEANSTIMPMEVVPLETKIELLENNGMSNDACQEFLTEGNDISQNNDNFLIIAKAEEQLHLLPDEINAEGIIDPLQYRELMNSQVHGNEIEPQYSNINTDANDTHEALVIHIGKSGTDNDQLYLIMSNTDLEKVVERSEAKANTCHSQANPSLASRSQNTSMADDVLTTPIPLPAGEADDYVAIPITNDQLQRISSIGKNRFTASLLGNLDGQQSQANDNAKLDTPDIADLPENITSLPAMEDQTHISNSSDSVEIVSIDGVDVSIKVERENCKPLRCLEFREDSEGNIKCIALQEEIVDLDESNMAGNDLSVSPPKSQLLFEDEESIAINRQRQRPAASLKLSGDVLSNETTSSGSLLNPGQRWPSSLEDNSPSVEGSQTEYIVPDPLDIIQEISSDDSNNSDNIIAKRASPGLSVTTSRYNEAANSFMLAQRMPSTLEEPLSTSKESTQQIILEESLPCSSESKQLNVELVPIVEGSSGQNVASSKGNTAAAHLEQQPQPMVIIPSRAIARLKTTSKTKVQPKTDLVPQLTHPLRSLPLGLAVPKTRVRSLSADAINSSNFQPSIVSTQLTAREQQPKRNDGSIQVTQELMKDCTVFDNSSLLRAADQPLAPAKTIENALEVNNSIFHITSLLQVADEGHIDERPKTMPINAQPRFTCHPVPTLFRHKTLLFCNLLEFHYFDALTPEQVCEYQLPSTNYGQPYCQLTISCGDFKTKLSNVMPPPLVPMRTGVINADFLAVLKDMQEFHYSPFKRKEAKRSGDLRERILYAYIHSSSPFCYAQLLYNPSNAEYSVYRPMLQQCRCDSKRRQPYRKLTYAIKPSILEAMKALKAKLRANGNENIEDK